MVWNYLFASGAGIGFNPQLLQHIKDKNNEQVQLILRNAKNLCSTIDFTGASLLHYAAECGNEIIIQVLLESGAKVDLQDNKGQTPLVLATKGEYEDTIRVLLDHDADIYIADQNGVSALQSVVQETLMLPSIVEMFLAQVKIDCSTPEDIARKLSRVNCPLYIAVRMKNVDVVKRMLSEGSAINATDPNSNQTALHVAVKNKDVEMVKLLVDRGADVNVLDFKNQTPLSSIRTFDNLEILKILVKAKTELTWCTEDGFMQMHWILTKGTREAVKIVLNSGLDLRAIDSHDRTAIHYLAINVNSGIVDALDDWVNGSTKSILYFILYVVLGMSLTNTTKKSVDWNSKDKDGRTILHDAMAVGNASFVEYLMEKGADANLKTVDGDTPFFETLLSESSLERRVECVKLIMKGGAYPDVEMKRYLKIRNTKSAINRDFSMLEPVLAHLVLRRAKGERISRKLLITIDSHPKLKDYVVSCKEELEEMKKIKVWQFEMQSKQVSLFDFLVDADYKLGFYDDTRFRMKKLVEEYEFDSYYSRILRQRLLDITKNVYFADTTLGLIISIAMLVVLILMCTLHCVPQLYRIGEILSTNNNYKRRAVLIAFFLNVFLMYFFVRDCYYYVKSSWIAYKKNLLVCK